MWQRWGCLDDVSVEDNEDRLLGMIILSCSLGVYNRERCLTWIMHAFSVTVTF